MLSDAARDLAPRGEMRIWLLEIGESTAAVNIVLAAGGRVSGFNLGFDERWARYKPGLVVIFAAIRDSFSRGEARFDFGGGGEQFKMRLGAVDTPICWMGIVPRNRRYLLTRIRLAPSRFVWRLTRIARRLPQKRKRQLRRLLRLE
jgi:CelD/BcsL family acetyltransferase involved in cellulose biosynthesis